MSDRIQIAIIIALIILFSFLPGLVFDDFEITPEIQERLNHE